MTWHDMALTLRAQELLEAKLCINTDRALKGHKVTDPSPSPSPTPSPSSSCKPNLKTDPDPNRTSNRSPLS